MDLAAKSSGNPYSWSIEHACSLRDYCLSMAIVPHELHVVNRNAGFGRTQPEKEKFGSLVRHSQTPAFCKYRPVPRKGFQAIGGAQADDILRQKNC